jgi:hypothetical protein
MLAVRRGISIILISTPFRCLLHHFRLHHRDRHRRQGGHGEFSGAVVAMTASTSMTVSTTTTTTVIASIRTSTTSTTSSARLRCNRSTPLRHDARRYLLNSMGCPQALPPAL